MDWSVEVESEVRKKWERRRKKEPVMEDLKKKKKKWKKENLSLGPSSLMNVDSVAFYMHTTN